MAKQARPDPQTVKLDGVNPRIEVFPGSPDVSYVGLSRLRTPFEDYGATHYLPAEIKRMMMRDPQVFASVMIWKTAVLVDGVQVTPCVDPDHPRYEKAKKWADYCRWCFDNLQGSFHGKLLQLLDCAVWGYKAGVKLFDEQTIGEHKGTLPLKRIRIVPNKDYKHRVDKFGNLVGLQSVNEIGDENIIRMGKFAYAVFRPEDDSCLGSNILFPAYSPFYDKVMAKPERMKNAAQFGSPSFWAEAPEGIKETALLGPDNKPIKDPQTGQEVMVPINLAMTKALEKFQGNGGIIVFPNTAQLHLIQAQGKGEVFKNIIDDSNMEIAKAILLTTLYTEQSSGGSTHASSKTGQGTVQLTVSDGKFMLADLIEEQLCKSILELNAPPNEQDLIPKVTLGNSKGDQLVSLYNAIAALYSVGFFDATQRAQLSAILGLPAPDPNAAPPAPTGQPTGNVKVNPDKPEKSDAEETEE